MLPFGIIWVSVVHVFRERQTGDTVKSLTIHEHQVGLFTLFRDSATMLRQILEYPDARLRRRATPVTEVTGETRALINDMAETMYQAPGIGLAAIQIGV